MVIRRSHVLSDALRRMKKDTFHPEKLINVDVHHVCVVIKMCITIRLSSLVRVELMLEASHGNSFGFFLNILQPFMLMVLGVSNTIQLPFE